MKTKLFLLTVIFCSTYLFSAAQIIHVPADQPTIQEGINVASNGDTVLASDGIYLENINFNGKAITVASQFIMDGDTNHINNTIINGSQPSNPDYGSVVTSTSGEDTTSIISGFTITGGTGMLDPNYNARIGGGIVCYNASAKIIHNKITGNVVTSTSGAWGGGVYIFKETGDGWAVITNNKITDNQCVAGIGNAEGGGLEIAGDARICDNVITYNHCSSSSSGADGGGVYHFSLSTPDTLLITKNMICNNILTAVTTARGGGVFVWASDCTIKQNIINYNSMTADMTNGCGLLLLETASTTITGNVVSHNTIIPTNIFLGAGCACIFPAGQLLVENNEFIANSGPLSAPSSSGGGLQIRDGFTEKVTVTGNIFINNAARFGGGFYSRSCYNLSVINNLFVGNESNDGGAVGMYIPESSEIMNPVFINNTLTNNLANNNGGAIHFNCETNLPILFNCLFYENTAPTGNDVSFVGSPDPIHLSYSDFDPNNISGPWSGEENINENPEFIDGDTLFHLSLTSPCKNEGSPSLEVNGIEYEAPSNDFDGEGRPDPLYLMFDIGADENWESPSAPLALNSEDIGDDYFVALWETSLLATGYFLDVAYDEGFNQMIPGYDNLDVGSDTTWVVTGLGSFPYYYRIRSYNALYTSDNSNTITVLETSIDDTCRNLDLSIHIIPNPAHDHVRIEILHNKEISLIEIINLQGTIVKKQKIINNLYTIYVGDLPNGIYILRIHTDKGIVNEKFLKR